MKINEIINEDADTGGTMAGNVASVTAPMSSKMMKRPKAFKSTKGFKGFKEYKLGNKKK